jgi:hypothetical protein
VVIISPLGGPHVRLVLELRRLGVPTTWPLTRDPDGFRQPSPLRGRRTDEPLDVAVPATAIDDVVQVAGGQGSPEHAAGTRDDQ